MDDVKGGVFALLDYMDAVAAKAAVNGREGEARVGVGVESPIPNRGVEAASKAGGEGLEKATMITRSHPSTEIYSLAFAACFEKVSWLVGL